MKNGILSEDHEAIIREWEKTHRPNKRKSALHMFEALILEKIEAGYTQQAVAELLCSLGCTTNHQNLSRYLKKHNANRPAVKQKSSNTTSSSKSSFSELRNQIRDQTT